MLAYSFYFFQIGASIKCKPTESKPVENLNILSLSSLLETTNFHVRTLILQTKLNSDLVPLVGHYLQVSIPI